MQRRGVRNGAAGVVRREGHIVCFAQGGHLLDGRDAAAVADVGLDEVRAAALKEVAHLREGIEPLA